MKSSALNVTLVLVLLTSAAQAFPPRMHTARGTVAAVDPKSQTLVLSVCCEKQQFALRGWTHIRINGRKVAPEEIMLGTPVHVSYRHEAGLQSLYEVRSIEARTACQGCVACALHTN